MNSLNDLNGVKPIGHAESVQALNGSQNNSTNIENLITGKNYKAEVISKSEDNTINIRISNTVFKIQLDNKLTIGETLTLRYLNSNPNPVFLLISSEQPTTNQIDKTELTQAAQNISQFIFESEKISSKLSPYQESQVLTNNPELPRLTAGNIKQAIDTSGLFYESHLADFFEGKRSLSLMMEEPQNKTNFDPAMLVVKQLEILEKNKLHWIGEVWPQQNMDWTTLIEKRPESNNTKDKSNSQKNNQTPITSILKFNFRNLGALNATLQMNHGLLQIKFDADDIKTSRILKNQLNMLALAIQNLGQKLDTIWINSP
jgi:hypothetical protein